MNFEGYKLVEQIHEGPSCEVWKAFNFELELPVAIKVFNPSLLGSEDPAMVDAWFSLFRNEADIHCRLNHPGITRFYHMAHALTGETGMVMEWLDGITLAECPKISPEIAGQIAVKCIAAIMHLHRPFHIGDRRLSSIAHGDIKPGNIFIAEDGVRLLDFGFSCPDLGMLEQGILGTPHYCRPDRMQGQSATWRDDSYALAMTLIEATESSQWDAPSHPVLAILKSLMNDAPPAPGDAIDKLEAILGTHNYGPEIQALTKSPKRDTTPTQQTQEIL